MLIVFSVALAGAIPFVQHYLSDPGPVTPVLPAVALWLPHPRPPSTEYVQTALKRAGRLPGDTVVAHWLEREKVGAARNYPGVGRAQLLQLTYRCEVIGPDGPYTVYSDRTVLVRAP